MKKLFDAVSPLLMALSVLAAGAVAIFATEHPVLPSVATVGLAVLCASSLVLAAVIFSRWIDDCYYGSK